PDQPLHDHVSLDERLAGARRRRVTGLVLSCRRRKTIAPPAHGHDEGLAEHAAKIAEGAGQRMVAHADAWPNLPEELLLGHHAIAVLDEMGKQIERLARNRDGRAPSSKLESFEVESEPSETDNGADGTAHLAFSRPTAGPRWIFPVHSGNSRSVT